MDDFEIEKHQNPDKYHYGIAKWHKGKYNCFLHIEYCWGKSLKNAFYTWAERKYQGRIKHIGLVGKEKPWTEWQKSRFYMVKFRNNKTKLFRVYYSVGNMDINEI